MNKILFSLITLLLIINLIGCYQSPPPPMKSIETLDRGRMIGVNMALKQDPQLAEFNIKVDVVNYTVTITGQVETEKQKKKAEEVVKSVSGVEKVVNKLEVKPPAGGALEGNPTDMNTNGNTEENPEGNQNPAGGQLNDARNKMKHMGF